MNFWRIISLSVLALTSFTLRAEEIAILHLGDQESWLISAQGNLRDNASQALSFYGGVDRMATLMANVTAANQTLGRSVIKLNAGDALLPGPRLTASFQNLGSAYADGGQDFYDAIALRQMDFDAVVFGNHEFDLGADIAARFAEVSETTYLSINLDFNTTPAFVALEAAGKVAPSKVITTSGGSKLGIIGVTTPILRSISRPGALELINFNPANTEAQNIQALLPLIQAEIDHLRTQESVDVVIIVSHLQNAANERDIMVPGLSGVDLVVSGGGHELMKDPDDVEIPGAIAPAFVTHPIFANDSTAKPTPIVTGHFGNRYLGELILNVDDATGEVTMGASRMLRVSGAAADADRVTADPTLNSAVVQPVLNYINALNAQIIGTTGVPVLNGARGVATGVNFQESIRNSETNLGNLVADAMRYIGNADVAIQNGGGIRVSIPGPGNVSVGDTFNVLPFTNIVKVAPTMTAAQLKTVLEHGYGAASPLGAENGRFPQISGMRVWYTSSLPAGSRIVRIVLDNGAVLVDGGVVNPAAPTFSFATIDFTANGGDGYSFAGVTFENNTFAITYQEALADFISTPKSAGGLGRVSTLDGDEITTNMYGEENAFDNTGRAVDLAISVATPGNDVQGTAARNNLSGTTGDDTINGGALGDNLVGGAGADVFVYTDIRDAGDTITDFTPYADTLDVSALLTSLGYTGTNAVGEGYIRIVDIIGGVSIQYDRDGFIGAQAPRPLVTLKGLVAHQIQAERDFMF